MAYNVATRAPTQRPARNDSSTSSPARGRVASRDPSTPPRGQLGPAPLHRRGTSHIYERFEDLLKEAGYADTKISTPEAERTEAPSEGRSSRVRSGVGAVVDFISGWIPGSTSHNNLLIINNTHEPPSPSPSPSPSPLPSNRLSARFDSPHRRGLRPRSSATDSLRAYAQRAALQSQLRPMASTPNIGKRTTSSTDTVAKRLPSFLSHEPPPRSKNRVNTRTRAVARSSFGEHVGDSTFKRVQNRSSHDCSNGSREGKGALSDRTNRIRPLTGYLHPTTAPSTVCTVRVVCRSAPASRSSSRSGARRACADDTGKQRDTRKPKGKKPAKSAESAPSLASTLLEDDIWDAQWVDGRRISANPSDEMEDSDSDEGELDLARILVDPKHQNSIHSLRRHLHRSESARALREHVARQSWMFDDDLDSSSKSGLRRSSRSASIEGGDGLAWGDLPGFDLPQTRKPRRGVPGTWSRRTLRS